MTLVRGFRMPRLVRGFPLQRGVLLMHAVPTSINKLMRSRYLLYACSFQQAWSRDHWYNGCTMKLKTGETGLARHLMHVVMSAIHYAV